MSPPAAAPATGRAAGAITKRSVTVAGHRTSVSLEPEFWAALRDIAAARGVSVNALIGEIDRVRAGNLSSAIRVFVLDQMREHGGAKERDRPQSSCLAGGASDPTASDP